jgi:acetyl esterase/lipase
MMWQLVRGVHGVVRLRRKMRGPKLPSWDARYETLAAVLHHYAKRSTWLPLAIQRHAATKLLRPTKATERCRFDKVQLGARRVAGEWFRHDDDSDAVLLYLHGGGYSIGSIDTHRDFIARLSHKAGVVGFAVDYRLAPEHPFPAQLEDALLAYEHVLAAGHDAGRVVVAGESAGGGLTLSLLLKLRELGRPMPAAAVLISPWIDLEMTAPSIDENEAYDFVNRKTLEAYAKRFVTNDQRRDPLAAPIHADLRGLPPLLVHAGGAEALADDASRIAERARDAGVEVELTIYPEMIHAFHLFGGFIQQANSATDDVASFIRQRLANSHSPGG